MVACNCPGFAMGADYRSMVVLAVVVLNIFYPGKYLFRRKEKTSSRDQGGKSDA